MQTATCPQCRHEVAGRMVRCLYCGAELARATPAKTRGCPRCAKPMRAVPARWAEIDRCDACAGEFYDTGELERTQLLDERDVVWLRETLLPRPHDTRSGDPLRCPACGDRMDTLLVVCRDEFLLDRCVACCGIWLDAGEPAKLKRAVRARGESGGAGADLALAASRTQLTAGGSYDGPDAVDLAVDALSILSDLLD